ncbi:PH domain leucine-rich repeat-containing protein phosphatase 1 [Varanus komodoensis]|nr:PH domain leucine-rich repeat-containing protein phosphatase 1 [Varanus komodoensis]
MEKDFLPEVSFEKALTAPQPKDENVSPTELVASQRISSVDLSCCSLEDLPANLFYSQDLTHLNLKQNFLRLNPAASTARGLNELQRFSKLRSLNLSNNHLGDFPLAVCSIPTLTELNVSCNALQTIPAAVGDMTK